jgi:hypothetical protein
MKKSLIRAAGVAALGLICLYTNAQTPGDTVPDFGSVTGSTYANKYFGLTLTIPAGWSVQDSGFKKQMSDKGKELVTSDDPNKKSEINRAVDNTLNLLTITERPPGEPGPFNAMFTCGAERFPAGVKTDADYMSALKNTLKYAQVPITIEKDIYSEQIGGVAFSVIDYNINYSGVIVSQKYFAHIVKNYVLFFIIIYQTPEQLKTLRETLRSVTLQ